VFSFIYCSTCTAANKRLEQVHSEDPEQDLKLWNVDHKSGDNVCPASQVFSTCTAVNKRISDWNRCSVTRIAFVKINSISLLQLSVSYSTRLERTAVITLVHFRVTCNEM